MLRKFTLLISLFLAAICLNAQSSINKQLPVRGFSIEAPRPQSVDKFINFIEHELAARQINVLILRVDYNYQYKSHPELRDSVALTEPDVKKLVIACKEQFVFHVHCRQLQVFFHPAP